MYVRMYIEYVHTYKQICFVNREIWTVYIIFNFGRDMNCRSLSSVG